MTAGWTCVQVLENVIHFLARFLGKHCHMKILFSKLNFKFSFIPIDKSIVYGFLNRSSPQISTRFRINTYRQYGFRKKHSSREAIVSLADMVLSAMDSGNSVLCIFLLGSSKAFDTINHQIFLNELMYINFDRFTVQLIKSYRHSHQQITT